MPKKVPIAGNDTTAIKISTEGKECLCIVNTDHQVDLVADRHISKYMHIYLVDISCADGADKTRVVAERLPK